ncbi:ATP-binding protein [Parasphingopyxis marina]|uniref:DUF87 domain-containing protein n=1 Tax=Parasphingopyxis marina TaxID=2761622 RepID=A0A842HVE4_9SPHN|nr:DUF87 domain-containing protein [Parasphingopyxis marina]MBC2776407.1 DUF87 domain-containing protein [Parasphingopyxis marina]
MDDLGTFRPVAEDENAEGSSLSAVQDSPEKGVIIGKVIEIAGSGSRIAVDAEMLKKVRTVEDPTLAMAGQVGSQVKMKVGDSWLVANVRTLSANPDDPSHVTAYIDFLGEGVAIPGSTGVSGFRRGVTRFPIPGTPVLAVSDMDMRQMFAAENRAHIEIGNVYPTKDIRGALYVDAMLGKHFAVLGSTGTGKSTSVALILHRICELAPEGHIVMVDPHGEYSAAFKGAGEIFDVNNIQLPYWLMNFEEHCEVLITTTGADKQRDRDILAKCLLAARNKNRLAEEIPQLTVDSPIPYMLSDLISNITTEMGHLDSAKDTAPYMRLKSKLEELKADPRYSFMFSGMLVGDTMAEFIAKVFRLPGNGKPISIVDVSGVPSDITSVVVAVLSRMVFDYAIWSRNEAKRPILLVCEEAHRYIPAGHIDGDSAVGKILARIAKEGRKYGVSLGLVTQRPSDLAEGVLSQCGTILAMRLNNDRDQAHVRSAMPEGARGFLDVIPALRNREVIVCGEGVSVPVRIAFDNLEEEKRPASGDPLFSELWTQTGDEAGIVERTIKRWRSQGR